MRSGDRSWAGERLRPLVAVVALLPAACASDAPLNPSFPLRLADAKADLRRMRESPRLPARPVVVVTGLFDLGLAAEALADELRRVLADDAPVLPVSLDGTWTPEDARRRVIEAVEAAFPSDDPRWTAEVDVVGVSLGGVVARDAAVDHGPGQKRLRIARLFTIASPHRGCPNATAPTLDERIVALRPGSEFLRRLDAALADAEYEIVPYVRLGDRVVGAVNAGIGDRPAYWVPTGPLEFAHAAASDDPRIIADIARRLRGERAWTVPPPSPLPDGETPDPPPPETDTLLLFP
jgi:hypothetical protein